MEETRKKLDVKYPIVTISPWRANLFTMLSTFELANGWIYSNFILLKRDVGYGTDFCNLKVPLDCPLITTEIINRSTIIKNDIDLVKLFINAINSNSFIYVDVDRNIYLGYGGTHPILIFGYDINTQEFDVADYIFQGTSNYSFGKVSFKDINKAFLSDNNKYGDSRYEDTVENAIAVIELYSLDKNAVYKFNTELVKQSFICFIESKSPYRSDVFEPINFKDRRAETYEKIYGFKVYEYFLERLDVFQKRKYTQPTHLQLFLDHKNLMLKRIEYMINNRYLDMSHEVLNDFDELSKQFLMLRNLQLKAVQVPETKSGYYFDKIRSLIKTAGSKEKYLYEKVVNNIVVP